MDFPIRSVEPAPTLGATFRLLQEKGLSPGEAASLTAFICGLPTGDLHLSRRQINEMLFLQRLYRLGRFGLADGGRVPPR